MDRLVVNCDILGELVEMVEVRLKGISFGEVGFNFFHPSLYDVDLASCRLAHIVLSDAMGEMHGCMMDIHQVAGITQRLGVIIGK